LLEVLSYARDRTLLQMYPEHNYACFMSGKHTTELRQVRDNVFQRKSRPFYGTTKRFDSDGANN